MLTAVTLHNYIGMFNFKIWRNILLVIFLLSQASCKRYNLDNELELAPEHAEKIQCYEMNMSLSYYLDGNLKLQNLDIKINRNPPLNGEILNKIVANMNQYEVVIGNDFHKCDEAGITYEINALDHDQSKSIVLVLYIFADLEVNYLIYDESKFNHSIISE